MKCYNCGYSGQMDWHWFVIDLDDDDNSFATSSLSVEHNNNPKYNPVKIEHCPQCNAEQ